jgi:hypothetical protein
MGDKSVACAALFAAAVGLGLTGCQSSPLRFHNPFERTPRPEVKSPAEMDDIHLKAPPERYTKDDYLRRSEKDADLENSLAQRGEYGSREKAPSSDSEKSRDVEKTAMREDVTEVHSETYGDAAPGFDDYPSDSAPFAPGSIGEIDTY